MRVNVERSLSIVCSTDNPSRQADAIKQKDRGQNDDLSRYEAKRHGDSPGDILSPGRVGTPARRKSLSSRPDASPLNRGFPISSHFRARFSKSVWSINSFLFADVVF